MIHTPIGRRVSAVACAAAIATAGGFTAVAAAATGGSPAIGTGHTRSATSAAPPANAHVFTGQLPRTGATGTAFPAAATVSSGAQPRVVGGSPVDSSLYPSVVGIATFSWFNGSRYENFCTGTILSATKVLTTANCVDDALDATTYVIAGRDDLTDTSSGFVSRAGSIWTDPTYHIQNSPPPNGTPIDNTAVITLTTALPAAYPPIALTAQGDSSPYTAGASATTVGYGMSQDADYASAGVLHAGSVQVQSAAACASSGAQFDYPFDATMLTCAGTAAGGAATTGPAACEDDQGGPLLENGVEVGITDVVYNGYCGKAGYLPTYEKLSAYNTTLTAGAALTPAEDLEFSGSGHADIMAVDGSGDLQLYSGSGFINQGDTTNSSFVGSTRVGTGWGGFKYVLRMTDWEGDGAESIFAVAQNGDLYEYQTDGVGDFTHGGNGLLIGTGFQNFTKLVAANNFTGDGKPDLIGVAANGNLDLYEGNKSGGWNNSAPIVIGTGWGVFTQLVSVGDWNKDGHQVLLGQLADGTLHEYESTGVGTWTSAAGQSIGTNFTMYTKLLAVGDWNGDQAPDLIGVDSRGGMYLYETDGKGGWSVDGDPIGVGFTFPQIF